MSDMNNAPVKEANAAQGRKQLLEGYGGIKFQPIQWSGKLRPEVADLYVVFKRTCDLVVDTHVKLLASEGTDSGDRGI